MACGAESRKLGNYRLSLCLCYNTLSWRAVNTVVGSSVSLGSTVLTAFDQLRDDERHPERAADGDQDRNACSHRCPSLKRRATFPSCPIDNDRSSAMPSLIMSDQSRQKMAFSDRLSADPPSSLSSSLSSQCERHHDEAELEWSTQTGTPPADDCADPVMTSPVDAECPSPRRDSSDNCPSSWSSPSSPPVPQCSAVLSSAAGAGRCVVQPAVATGSSNSSYRNRVVAEIIDTERKYVRDLRQIINVSSSFVVYHVVPCIFRVHDLCIVLSLTTDGIMR